MAFHRGPKIVTDGLVMYLDAANPKSYPGTGTGWTDMVGSNNGTLTNGPTFNSGSAGSIEFDGVDDYVNCGNSLDTLSSNLLSVFSWFKCTSTTNEPLLFRTTNYSSGWNISVSNGILRTTLRPSVGNNNNIYSGTIATDTWYYGGFTCDGTTIKQYLNGINLSQTPVATTLNLNNSDTLLVGGNLIYGTYSMQGSIQVAQIYSRALIASEVLQNYNATKSRYEL